MSDEQLDVEIDRAVREMMSVDAPGGFRARILSKLEERPRRFGWLGMAGLGSAVAAAAIVLVMVRGPRPAAPAAAPGPLPVVLLTALPGHLLSKPVAPAVDLPRSGIARHTPIARANDLVVAANVTPEPQPAIAALHEIDPLFVSPVAHRNIDPAAIAIAPLAIPQVRVDPLSPPQGRN
jgi:hypothetical protein